MAPPGDKAFVFIGYNTPTARATPEAKAVIRRRALIFARQAKLESRSKKRAIPSDSNCTTGSTTPIAEICEHCRAPGCRQEHSPSSFDSSQLTQQHVKTLSYGTLSPAILNCNVTDPFGALLAGGIGDLAEIGRWYFHNQVAPDDAINYEHAIALFSRSTWEMAKNDEIAFNCIIASVLRKKAYFLEGQSERLWLMYKGRILFKIQKAIDRRELKHDPMLIVAIAMLVTFDIGDRDFAAAKAHLDGLRSMIRMDQLTEDQWLYVTFTDLRFSLLLNTKPTMPYYVPSYYRADHPVLSRQSQKARRLALYNSRQSPGSASICTGRTFDVFRRLHELGLASNALDASDRLPLGEVYALEHQLLSSRVDTDTLGHNPASYTNKAIELVFVAAHLQTLLLSRCWTPQRHQTPMLLLRRAMKPMMACPDLPAVWSQCASLESLLWILFMFTASMLDLSMHLQTPVPMLRLLRDVTDNLQLRSYEAFICELCKWPWAEEWHPPRAKTLWNRMQDSDKTSDLNMSVSSSVSPSSTRKLDRLYIGTFQFYTTASNT